jgi:hypothetical protein
MTQALPSRHWISATCTAAWGSITSKPPCRTRSLECGRCFANGFASRDTILADTGVDQGCPGSSPLACLGISDFHESMSEHCFTVGCQDDTYLLISQAGIKESLEAIAPALAPTETSLNLRKSCIWSPGTCNTGNSCIQRSETAPLVLKQPLLTHDPNMLQTSCGAGVDKIASSRTLLFDRLQDLKASGLSTQHAVCIARAVTNGDSVYLQQCHALKQEHTARLDQICLDGLLTLLEVDPSENDALGIASTRWFLPWKRGGFGFQSTQHSALANFAGSWFRDLHGLAESMDVASPQSLLDRAVGVRASLEESIVSLSALGASIPTDLNLALTHTEGVSKLARQWRSEVVARISNNVESGAANEHVNCMRESGGTGSGGWLNFPRAPSHHFTNQEFRTAVRLRMHLDVFSKGPTQTLRCKHQASFQRGGRICNEPLDTKGHHALLCKLGGLVVRRHNEGRDCLAELISARVQSTVHVEQHTPDMTSDQRHPDIDFYDHNQRHVFVDIEVCTPHAGSPSSSGALPRAGTLIETAEGVKRRKYRHLIIMPAVCSHLGRFGKSVQSVLRLICRETDEAQRSASINACYQTLGCQIQKSNVALLGAAWSLL